MIDERTLNAFVARMRNRIRLMVGRVLLSIVDDDKTIQTAQVQGLAGEVLEDVKASTGIFEINDLTFDTPVMKVTGDVQDHAGGAGARTMMQMRGTFNSHTHPETNASGGSTQPPDQEM